MAPDGVAEAEVIEPPAHKRAVAQILGGSCDDDKSHYGDENDAT